VPADEEAVGGAGADGSDSLSMGCGSARLVTSPPFALAAALR
jgi:hypothetical protein